jgi:hypothetical protein
MGCVLFAETAKLGQLNALGVVLLVFDGVVIALLALIASQYDVRARVFHCH